MKFSSWHDLKKRGGDTYSSSACGWVDSAHPPEAEESTALQTEKNRPLYTGKYSSH